jgi:hypothetical protein
MKKAKLLSLLKKDKWSQEPTLTTNILPLLSKKMPSNERIIYLDETNMT